MTYRALLPPRWHYLPMTATCTVRAPEWPLSLGAVGWYMGHEGQCFTMYYYTGTQNSYPLAAFVSLITRSFHVCSVLDYPCPICDPFHWKAARFMCKRYHTTSSVTAMLGKLGWGQLEKWQRDVQLALLFKVVHGHFEGTTLGLNLTKADSRTRSNHPNNSEWKEVILVNFGISSPLEQFLTGKNLPASIVIADSMDAF